VVMKVKWSNPENPVNP